MQCLMEFQQIFCKKKSNTACDTLISDSAKDTCYILRYREQSWLKSDELRT